MSKENHDQKSAREDAPAKDSRRFALDRAPAARAARQANRELSDELAELEREARAKAARIRFAPLLRELDRRRAEIARMVLRERSGLLDPTALPARVTDKEWSDLWDAMEREVNAPQKGWATDDCDPASPEANPEIGEWEKHWPSVDRAPVVDAPAKEPQPADWRGPLLARLLKLRRERR